MWIISHLRALLNTIINIRGWKRVVISWRADLPSNSSSPLLAREPTVVSCFCFCELCKCIRNMTTTEWTVTWYLQIQHKKFYHHCNTKYRIMKLNSRQPFLLVFEVWFTDVWFSGISKADTASISCFHKYGPSHRSSISCVSTQKFQGSQIAVCRLQTCSGIGLFRCIWVIHYCTRSLLVSQVPQTNSGRWL